MKTTTVKRHTRVARATGPYDPMSPEWNGRPPTKKQLRDGLLQQVGCEQLLKHGPSCLGYLEFFADADERAAKGETQKKCVTCSRYRWTDEAKFCTRFKEVG